VCSIARSLEVVGERWTLLILRDACLGLTRFEEFRASLGIATNVLSVRLERLCDEGLLERRPDRYEYVLTRKGRELAPALIMLMKWGDRDCGGRVNARMRCGRCRRHVDFAELEIRPGPGLRPAA
jgi:DNA-binding HxlR family transcriptional regulator